MSKLPTHATAFLPSTTLGLVGRFGRALALVVLAAALLASCSISPQPVPPPVDDPISIQAELIKVEDDGAGAGVWMRGLPGAVTPGAEVLRAVNRITIGPAIDVPVLPDGGFELFVQGTAKDAFRAQARKGDSYSDPVDVQGLGDGAVVEIDPSSGSCVKVDPVREIVFPATPVGGVEILPVLVRNECPFDLQIVNFSSMSGNASFEPMLGTFSSGFVKVGGDAFLGVAFHPVSEGLQADELWIEFLPQPEPQPEIVTPWLLSVRGTATIE
jgi:hypothetical protein